MPLSVKQLLLALIMLLMGTVSLSGCGKIGDPVPPGTYFSQALTDRSARGEKQGDYTNVCRGESNVAESNLQEKD